MENNPTGNVNWMSGKCQPQRKEKYSLAVEGRSQRWPHASCPPNTRHIPCVSHIPLRQERDRELGRAGAVVPPTHPSIPQGLFPASQQQISSSSGPSNPH